MYAGCDVAETESMIIDQEGGDSIQLWMRARAASAMQITFFTLYLSVNNNRSSPSSSHAWSILPAVAVVDDSSRVVE